EELLRILAEIRHQELGRLGAPDGEEDDLVLERLLGLDDRRLDELTRALDHVVDDAGLVDRVAEVERDDGVDLDARVLPDVRDAVALAPVAEGHALLVVDDDRVALLERADGVAVHVEDAELELQPRRLDDPERPGAIDAEPTLEAAAG